MPTITHPTVVKGQWFELFHDDEPCITDTYYLTPLAAQQARVETQPSHEVPLQIRELTTAYYARCVVCGDFPEDDNYLLPSWSWVREIVRYAPGWRAGRITRRVYCPDH